jgi:UPF0176 protein
VLPHLQWEEILANELILTTARLPVGAAHIVRAGERYLYKLERIIEPEVNASLQILHEDEALIVLNKPAPLPVHPSGRFNRNTLQFILNELYYPQKPRPAHRLDANTTGLVLVARTRHFAAKLQPQFERGAVKKTYLARVQGSPREDHFACDAPISTAPGNIGTRGVDYESGLPSRTEFTVLERFSDGTTVLEARPLTGRTNQIRVHLWEMGWPIVGDAVYLPGKRLGGTQTLRPGDPPLCLHAAEIEFSHPLSNERMRFVAPSGLFGERSGESAQFSHSHHFTDESARHRRAECDILLS